MPGTLDPQRSKCTRTSFVDCQSVRKVDHFIFGAMDDKNRRRNARHFVDTDNNTHHTTYSNSNPLMVNKLQIFWKLSLTTEYTLLTDPYTQAPPHVNNDDCL